ncbi:hypothetical protein DPEC_G00206600 [Dallia pectoralis]|uniref:Uncharacterized protein n=1 Tax=Dallia pectoralis TaxID=75939 RepID=A0ACC2G4U2_DALPE|nr:hypothetical protein DPEC_G00206600 [Dallia pectoralis]
MYFSMDSADSTSTQTSLDKAVDEDKRSGMGRVTNFKLLKKTNKVAPFFTTINGDPCLLATLWDQSALETCAGSFLGLRIVLQAEQLMLPDSFVLQSTKPINLHGLFDS